MEQIPFLSIVMPVYHVEKHLEKAVDSILNQDFNDWELILVDDCSRMPVVRLPTGWPRTTGGFR